jgi:hypothetical protein
MAERIDDPLVGQNAIGGHQFFDNEIELAHAALLSLVGPRSYGGGCGL